MAGKGAFSVEGRVVSVRGPGVADVELANGHRLVGYLRRRDRARADWLAAGVGVTVELTPYDLSAGRMRLQTDRKHES